MNIYHLLLETGCPQVLASAGRLMGKGDVLVVAPGEALKERYASLLERQLVQRRDVLSELNALGKEMKAMAPDSASFAEDADAMLERIHTLLCQGMSLTFRDSSLTDYLQACLSLLCAQCTAAVLGGSPVIDGRELVVCERGGGIPVVDRKVSGEEIRGRALASAVVAGGYGRTLTGDTVCLGKGGALLTASLIAACRSAACVRCVLDEFPYEGAPQLTYDEAAQRFSGNAQLYPKAMLPLRPDGIPLEAVSPEGALLVRIVPSRPDVPKGITGVVLSGPMTLFTVYGTGLLGRVGLASALFGALARDGVNIHFISQAHSEYSISFAVKQTRAASAASVLESLVGDTPDGDIRFISRPVEIVSIFGQGMRNVPGISGKVFTALGEAGVNVIASSQGGEELSISVVVEESAAARSLETLSHLQ